MCDYLNVLFQVQKVKQCSFRYNSQRVTKLQAELLYNCYPHHICTLDVKYSQLNVWFYVSVYSYLIFIVISAYNAGKISAEDFEIVVLSLDNFLYPRKF